MDVRTVTPDPRLLHSTAAVSVANGVIGAPNGSTNDTVLQGVTILLNAGPGKLTITGFRGEDGVARSILLTGSATADTQYAFPGLRNTGGPMTLTATVADVVLVSVQQG